MIIIIIIRFREVGLMLVVIVFHDLKFVFEEFVASGFLDQELVLSIDKTWFLITGCPTRYRTQHFFNNSNTNEDIATKFEQ
jgi:hypothetical protein